MGTYDTIICKMALPLPDLKSMEDLFTIHFAEIKTWDFQTKDLEKNSQVYEIRDDGTLWVEKHNEDWRPGQPETTLGGLGYFNRTLTWWEPVPHTGTVRIYGDGIVNDNLENDYMFEYTCQLLAGKVESIAISDLTVIANAKRKTKEKVYNERMKLTNEFRKTWFFVMFYKHYLTLVKGCVQFPIELLMGRYSYAGIFLHNWLDFVGRGIDKKSGFESLYKKNKLSLYLNL